MYFLTNQVVRKGGYVFSNQSEQEVHFKEKEDSPHRVEGVTGG